MPVSIDYPNRRVRAAVRELADLAAFRRSGGPSLGLTRRAQVGSEWHVRIQAEGEEGSVQNEITCTGSITSHGWTFDLDGRIDQLIKRAEGLHLREIKTVASLPIDPFDFRQKQPAWFHQAALYRLLSHQPDSTGADAPITSAELLLVDLRTGLRLPIPLEPEDGERTRHLIDELAQFFEARRPAFVRDPNSTSGQPNAPRPFRPAQEVAFADLQRAFTGSRIVAFEAPTGFGKTAVFVRWAREQLGPAAIQRAIFLTGKRSGRIQILEELERELGSSIGAQVAVQRSRDESRPECPFPACRATSCDPSAPPVELHHLLPPDTGTRSPPAWHSVPCPYQLGRAKLPFTPIWVADLNYLFAESSNPVFLECPGFDPTTSILVIDEAHNLPDRVANAWSASISSHDLASLGEALFLGGSDREITTRIEELRDWTRALPAGRELSLSDIYWLEDTLELLLQQLNQNPPPDDLDDASIERLGRLRVLRTRICEETVPALRHSGPGAQIRVDCTDPSPVIARTLAPFNRVLLSSATLAPFNAFFQSIGATSETAAAVPAPPIWDPHQIDIAIDLRVDTRSHLRDRYLGQTATAVADFARIPSDGPTFVFCPSFRYLENLERYLREIGPELLIEAQDREDANPVQRLANALPLGDVFLLVLGSRLAEGIDLLGGPAGKAMIISPGVPEVSPVRRRAREDADLAGRDGFHQHFSLPGMRKVIQAIGRLIRSESHRARVVLHCRRFDQPDIRATFPAWWPEPKRIRHDSDWRNWLTCDT